MQKYVKYFFSSLVLLLPTIIFAEPQALEACVAPIHIKDGYYLGVAAGYDLYKMKDSIVYQNPDTFAVIKTDPELALNGMIGDFIVGYGKFFGKNKNLYGGIEFFANGSAADSDFQTSVSSVPVIIDTDVVVNGSFGLGFISGIKINHATMLYVKLGYNWSTISVDETARIQDEFEPASIEYHDEAAIHGFVYGIGLESAFNEQFSLRAEYTYSIYNSFIARSEAYIESSRNQFLLGLIYRFST